MACEEGLKAFASTTEESPGNRFWLVTLFGVWELALDKPFWGLVVAQSNPGWGGLEVLGFVSATALPVLMHTVTAAVYAFTFQQRLWAAFIASWVIHAAYNEAVDLFGLSAPALLTETAILVTILLAILWIERDHWRSKARPDGLIEAAPPNA